MDFLGLAALGALQALRTVAFAPALRTTTSWPKASIVAVAAIPLFGKGCIAAILTANFGATPLQAFGAALHGESVTAHTPFRELPAAIGALLAANAAGVIAYSLIALKEWPRGIRDIDNYFLGDVLLALVRNPLKLEYLPPLNNRKQIVILRSFMEAYPWFIIIALLISVSNEEPEILFEDSPSTFVTDFKVLIG
jgi:hypothetical protein